MERHVEMSSSISHATRRARTTVALAALSLLATLAWAPQQVRAADGDVFFSEYVEGTAGNQALELYNPSDVPVDLGSSGYSISFYADGSGSPTTIFLLNGVVAAHDVFVVANAAANAQLLSLADQTVDRAWFDGNDAILLVHSGTAVDRIGQVAFNPGTAWSSFGVSTVDSTLRRDGSVSSGDIDARAAFDPSLEWHAFATDDFSNLGSYGETPPPVVEPTTIDDLRALLDKLVGSGDVDAAKAGLFRARLDRAAVFLASGQTDAWASQLTAFGDQARSMAPRWLTQDAADALATAAAEVAAAS
jgi:hypothetical protein